VDRTFLDARKTPLSDRALRLMLVLDWHAGSTPWCFPSLTQLAAVMGRDVRNVSAALRELEADGWIARVHGPQNELQGVVLRHRPSRGMPVADTPEKVEAAAADVRAARLAKAKPKPKASAGRNHQAEPGQPGPSQPDEIVRLSLTKSSGSSLTKSSGELNTVFEEEPVKNDRSIDRPPLQKSEEADRNADALDAAAADIHARLYDGAVPGVAQRDWDQWAPLYRQHAAALLAGRLTPGQVDVALAVARKASTNHRGKRFNAAVKHLMAGRAVDGKDPRAVSTTPPADHDTTLEERIAAARAALADGAPEPPPPAPEPEPTPAPDPDPEVAERLRREAVEALQRRKADRERADECRARGQAKREQEAAKDAARQERLRQDLALEEAFDALPDAERVPLLEAAAGRLRSDPRKARLADQPRHVRVEAVREYCRRAREGGAS
jgi:hypothetical protein